MVAFSSRNMAIIQSRIRDVLEEIEYAIVDGNLDNEVEAIHAYLRERK